jgi:transcriptional regulator of arginine metabolism
MNKAERQNVIREIVTSRAVGSQEELRLQLVERGWDVTQSTLSRDLREMRLARIPTPDGVRYAVTDSGAGSGEDRSAALGILLPQLFVKLEAVSELIVLRTIPGGAQPVAATLDGENWPDILGTVGGDDTILIICRSSQARERVSRRIRTLAGRAG